MTGDSKPGPLGANDGNKVSEAIVVATNAMERRRAKECNNMVWNGKNTLCVL